MVGLQGLGLALMRREFHPPPGEQPPVPGQLRYPVALEQAGDAPGQLVHHRVLVGDHARHVHGEPFHLDADARELLLRVGVFVGCIEQALDGMQPQLRQVPPKLGKPSLPSDLSMHAVFMPSWAARIAAA